MGNNKNNIWTRIDRYPPILCRLLARRKHGPPLTTLEISDASGLDPAQVQALSNSTSWDRIEVGTMKSFLIGCGIDFTNRNNMKRIDVYLRGIKTHDDRRIPPSFSYLRRSAEWDSLYKPLIRRWIASMPANTNDGATEATLHPGKN